MIANGLKKTKYLLIIKKFNDKFNVDRIKKMAENISTKHSVRIYVEPSFYKRNPLKQFNCFNEKIADKIDLCISIGGDGTILHLNSLFQKISVPPVLAFSTGHLGFLINFHQNDLEKIVEHYLIKPSNFSISPLFTLVCTKKRHGKLEKSYRVLNEITIERGEWLLPIPIEIFVNGKILTKTKADGIIVSTPTGSTAYSMSAGGSLVSPMVSAILITPICPHTLSFRPLIVPLETEIKIRVPKFVCSQSDDASAYLTFDGQIREKLKDDDEIIIKASETRFPIVRKEKEESTWYQSLRDKLHWNSQKL
ncbi:hypothetical protein MHBO_000818 [Bonamia ostreae]|uniref:NAD kinase n=1 Tax=Bonamia ostreae TaxID=126728 RepID=A0ABV2AH06_9EUKA